MISISNFPNGNVEIESPANVCWHWDYLWFIIKQTGFCFWPRWMCKPDNWFYLYFQLELLLSCHSSSDMKLTSCGRNPAFLKLFHFQHISLFVPTCGYRALIITFRFLTQVLDKNNNVMTEQQLHQQFEPFPQEACHCEGLGVVIICV